MTSWQSTSRFMRIARWKARYLSQRRCYYQEPNYLSAGEEEIQLHATQPALEEFYVNMGSFFVLFFVCLFVLFCFVFAFSHMAHVLSICVCIYIISCHICIIFVNMLPSIFVPSHLENVGECCKAKWVRVHQRIALYKSYLLLLLLKKYNFYLSHFSPFSWLWRPRSTCCLKNHNCNYGNHLTQCL